MGSLVYGSIGLALCLVLGGVVLQPDSKDLPEEKSVSKKFSTSSLIGN